MTETSCSKTPPIFSINFLEALDEAEEDVEGSRTRL